MSIIDLLYNNPEDAKRKQKNLNANSVFEDYLEFMEKQLLELEIQGLTPVTAQIAFIELRNLFFNQVDKKDASSVIDAVLQKPLDRNIYTDGINDILTEYINNDILNSLGMSFTDYLKIPYFLKNSMLKTLREKDTVKNSVENNEMKKREKELKNIRGGK